MQQDLAAGGYAGHQRRVDARDIQAGHVALERGEGAGVRLVGGHRRTAAGRQHGEDPDVGPHVDDALAGPISKPGASYSPAATSTALTATWRATGPVRVTPRTPNVVVAAGGDLQRRHGVDPAADRAHPGPELAQPTP